MGISEFLFFPFFSRLTPAVEYLPEHCVVPEAVLAVAHHLKLVPVSKHFDFPSEI